MHISVPMMLFGLAGIAAAGSLCGWVLEPGRARRSRLREERNIESRGLERLILEHDAAPRGCALEACRIGMPRLEGKSRRRGITCEVIDPPQGPL